MKLRCILLTVAVVSAIILSVVILNDNTSDYFEIDNDDLEQSLKMNENRMALGSYESKVELFMKKAISSDDLDGDGNSTIDNCIRFLKNKNHSNVLSIMDIASYVRTYEYYSDQELYSKFDWAAFPIETIHFGGGDCEDLSILFVSLAYRSGYDCGIALYHDHAVALVLVGMDEEPFLTSNGHHVEIDGKRYYILDLTDDFLIGQTYDRYSVNDIVAYRCVNNQQ